MSTTMPPVPKLAETKIHQFLTAARDDCGCARLLARHPVAGWRDKCACGQFLGRAARVR
jgi:hypothetical protein